MRGSVYKRCQCPVERNDKGERLACKKAHGSWSYVADAPVRRRPSGVRSRRAASPTKKAAEEALAELVDQAAKGTIANDGRLSVEAYLDDWIATKQRLGMRPTTARSYQQHIDDYIVPTIGSMRLRDVRPTTSIECCARSPRARRRCTGCTRLSGRRSRPRSGGG